jgi:hypothetical protein
MNRKSPGYYGERVESWVVERYELRRDYPVVGGNRFDASDPDTNSPVEIKAVGRNRSGGRANRVSFKVWRDQHRILQRADGYYVFVLYDLRQNGIGVVDSRSVRAGALSIEWYGRTQPRNEQQAEIGAGEIFNR